MNKKTWMLGAILLAGAWLALAGGTLEGQGRPLPVARSDPFSEMRSIFDPYQPALAASGAITPLLYLPSVQQHYIGACGVLPFLVSPADGSAVTPQTNLVFDGGYNGGSKDWLELNLSQTPDFKVIEQPVQYLQPAGTRWEMRISNFNLEPGQWYWRVRLWCKGPGWPPPPAGYTSSEPTAAWSFTLP